MASLVLQVYLVNKVALDREETLVLKDRLGKPEQEEKLASLDKLVQLDNKELEENQDHR